MKTSLSRRCPTTIVLAAAALLVGAALFGPQSLGATSHAGALPPPKLPPGVRAAAIQGQDLGSIDFPNSGGPAAQEAFIRGVLLLHSFEYEDSHQAFVEAQRIDPDFALAYWGEAMTFNHPLWFQQDLAGAREALAKLAPTPEQRLSKAPTERERGYLEAVEILYGEGDKASRDRAYMEAMHRLHERYPDDLEARAFYALSVLGSVRERDFRTYMQAGAIAEEVFAQNPRHPGAVHYLIHSYDDPIHAPLGLRAARRYAQIAPAASHAQHMISHIYTALGMWDEVIEANRLAVEVSEERLRRLGRPLHGRSHHALYWLEYGLLQQGRFDDARQALATMRADAEAAPNTGNLWHYAAMRAAYIVADPARDDAPAPMDLEDVALGAVAAQALSEGLRAFAHNRMADAEASLQSLLDAIERATEARADEGRNAYDGANDDSEFRVARIMERELEGMLRFREGDANEALALLAAATAAEAARPLEYGPPIIVKPSHELLGEMLLALDRPGDAREAFEKALERAPRRTQSLIGLLLAAEALGDTATAEALRQTLSEIWLGDETWTGEREYPWLQ